MVDAGFLTGFRLAPNRRSESLWIQWRDTVPFKQVVSSIRALITVFVLIVLPVLPACASHFTGPQGPETFLVDLHMSGYPGVRDERGITFDTLSFQVLVSGVQVLDTTFMPAVNVTGHVHSLEVRLSPGRHQFRVIDHRTSTVRDLRVRVGPKPMWVHVRFTNEGTEISAGEGFLGFL